jgi:uncharacterized membrane protein YcaP (DUF421 family)
MHKEDIDITDWERIFLGAVPPEFFIEVVIRVILFYMLAAFSVRLMGNRAAARLSRNELAALVSLAAAIGSPLQSPERGILPGFVIAFVIVLIGRLMARIAHKNQRFEKVTQGNISILVDDSVMNLEVMKKIRISRERLFAQLRHYEIKSLGSVKRLYMESNGTFSLIKEAGGKPGLSLIPEWDKELKKEQKQSPLKICSNCGGHQQDADNKDGKCPRCKKDEWVNAVYE